MAILNADKRVPAVIVTALAGFNMLMPDGPLSGIFSMEVGPLTVGAGAGIFLMVTAWWLWNTDI